jgi:hypothetical protein
MRAPGVSHGIVVLDELGISSIFVCFPILEEDTSIISKLCSLLLLKGGCCTTAGCGGEKPDEDVTVIVEVDDDAIGGELDELCAVDDVARLPLPLPPPPSSDSKAGVMLLTVVLRCKDPGRKLLSDCENDFIIFFFFFFYSFFFLRFFYFFFSFLFFSYFLFFFFFSIFFQFLSSFMSVLLVLKNFL